MYFFFEGGGGGGGGEIKFSGKNAKLFQSVNSDLAFRIGKVVRQSDHNYRI